MVQCVEKNYRHRCRWLKVAVENIGNHDVIDVKGAGLHQSSWDMLNTPCQNLFRMGSIKSLVQFIEVKIGSLDWRLCAKAHVNCCVNFSVSSLRITNYGILKTFQFASDEMRLILYSKPGCHLCEGLQSKLQQIVETRNLASLQLEVRDITICEDWFQAYQYEVPVLCRDAAGKEEKLPRPSPRASVQHLEQMLQRYLSSNDSK